MASEDTATSPIDDATTVAYDDMDYDASCARFLACAVISLAIEDAKTGLQVARLHAQNFLTAPEGGWAQSRVFWANMAGVDPDVIAERARKILT